MIYIRIFQRGILAAISAYQRLGTDWRIAGSILIYRKYLMI